ncbi:MAG TPA: alpha/beta hydrolase [Gemmatimonadaceae bacterium]|nr:alpha/beta hydrolase [Gemmatimonadaceae bacterium]
MSSSAAGPQHEAISQFRAYRRSLGRTPRLHRDTITLRGLQFAVFRTDDPGTGTLPLICVNGGLIFDHALLWPALSPLAAARQLIFYDQRGRGASAVPPGARASRVEFDAADLAALPEALGISRCHLLGHSWGGGIAMLSTRTANAHLASLTLINAVGLTGAWLPTLTPAALERLTPAQRERLLAADAAIRPGAPDAANPAALSEYAAAIYPAWFAQPALAAILSPPVSTSITGAAVSARLRRDGYDWRPLVPPVTMPTLLLHGTADLFPLGIARDTVAVLGALARLLPIDGAGHNPFWEQPSIVFSSIDAFLTAADSVTP